MGVRRGDVWNANIRSAYEEEDDNDKNKLLKKERPVIVLACKKTSDVVTVVPITSHIKREDLETHVILDREFPFIRKKSMVVVEQIQTIPKYELKDFQGYLPDWKLLEVGNAITFHLGFGSLAPKKVIENVKRIMRTLDTLCSQETNWQVEKEKRMYISYLCKICKENKLTINVEKYIRKCL